MKKYILLIMLLLLGCFSTTSVNAEAFTIKSYDVKLNVNKDKTINVYELINVNFTEPRHGIFRRIPILNKITRQDGTYETLKARINKVKTNNTYQISRSMGDVDIKMGDAESLITGNHSYFIQYNYQIPKSKRLKNKDELYFNIIGNDWDVDIEKVHFKIIMPKEFDEKKLGFSIGEKGNIGYDKNQLKYSVLNNEIQGDVLYKLHPNEGLTLRLELDKDYFEYKNEFFLPFKVITAFILLLLTLISYNIWTKIGKDEQIVPVVSFYPPEDLNSATVGAYYRQSPNDKDIVSLIIYLASKGYLSIDCSKNINKDNCFLRKLKEPDDLSGIEFDLMDTIFREKDKVSLAYLAESSDYYQTCLEIKKELKASCDKLYNPNSTAFLSGFIPFVFAVVSLFVLVYSLFDYFGLSLTTVWCSIYPIAVIYILGVCLRAVPLFAILFSIIFVVGFCYVFSIECFSLNYDILSLSAFITLSANIAFFAQMPKKSKSAIKLLGNIEGFKKFIEVVQKHRVELLVKENPSYCFDVLPYAYVLNVSDEWIKNFAKFMNTKYWAGELDPERFRHFSKACASSMKPSVENGGISQSSSSSSGGYSGGGYSGGGFGGGGGGSW